MIHVAVLYRPYIDALLAGRKTIECRLTRQPRPPYDVVEPGDRIFFKQSAGPYRAAAIAEHVICEDKLTPGRVRQIRRDYNELICGEPAFWNAKRDSRYCTLIWLKHVQPSSTGPAIRPLQGLAWLTLDDAPTWTSQDRTDQSFHVVLTPGNLRNNSIYVSRIIDRFPRRSIGGATKRQAADPLTLILHGGPSIETDIVGPRTMLRTRAWGSWFKRHGARAGDFVVFTAVDESTFFVALARGDSTQH
ncbi:MAG: hypothetical protein ACE10B_03590 [Phycisphaerales bacterium]